MKSFIFYSIVYFSCLSITLCSAKPKKAIVIGASSGMGKEVAKLLATDGYTVGLAARRLPLLQEVQQAITTKTYIKQIDASKQDEATQKLEELINDMGGLDLLVLSISGIKDIDLKNQDWKNRNWTLEKSILDVDILGFYALARTAINFFEKQGHGHFVGISSIDALKGNGYCPVYSAAKAFCSRYMEGEHKRLIQTKIPITITEIIPGFVNSKEVPNSSLTIPKHYWIESLQDAAQEIFLAIKNKERVAYITKRWQQFAEKVKNMPDDFYNAFKWFFDCT